MSYPQPTAEQAWEFVLMLKAGLPLSDAIRYFVPPEEALDPQEVKLIASQWAASAAVGRAQLKLHGKRWQDMSLEEMIKVSLDKTYAEMAYMLFTRNYAELSAGDKAKADTARQVLEAKQAGSSGALSPLDRFYQDYLAMKRGATLPPVQKAG